jgi:hypothetical protein
MFHETFGVYAQGVGYETITTPEGWNDRLIAADVVRSRAPTIDPGVDVDELTSRVERLLNSADSIYLHLRGAAASTGSVSQ